ncbi:hypothetical protein BHE74_00035568 [Ensete ventricosum]|nr:hypothetical protein BHE74_00035568 [Ensete ventricosum]
MEGLRVELPKEAIAKYKKSAGFEMGLVQMSHVSYEYGYWVVVARFRARYPDLKIEVDPFKLLPEDSHVSMAAKQPFDDSLPPPKE